MARTTETEVPEGAEPEVGKRRSKLIPVVVLAVALLGGGYYLGFGKAASAESASGASTTTTTLPGPVVGLEAITLNVPGNHYLKVGLVLQMAAPKEGEEAPAADDADADTSVTHAPVLDTAIDVFGGRSYEDLVTPGGREAAKQELIDKLRERYGGKLEDIYFSQFVLQ